MVLEGCYCYRRPIRDTHRMAGRWECERVMSKRPETLGHLLDHYKEMTRLHNTAAKKGDTYDGVEGAMSIAYRSAYYELRRILTGENIVGDKVGPSLIERIDCADPECSGGLMMEMEPRDG